MDIEDDIRLEGGERGPDIWSDDYDNWKEDIDCHSFMSEESKAKAVRSINDPASIRNDVQNDIFQLQQRLLGALLKRPVKDFHSLPISAPEQEKLLDEMKNSYHKRQKAMPLRPKSEERSLFARQRQLLEELCKQSDRKIREAAMDYIEPQPSVPVTLSVQPKSPVSVTEQLSEQQRLLNQQQKTLQESIKKSLETRQALYAKSERTHGYQRAYRVHQVLRESESSSFRILTSRGSYNYSPFGDRNLTA